MLPMCLNRSVNELERMWIEESLAALEYNPWVSLKRLIRSRAGRDLNQATLKYES